LRNKTEQYQYMKIWAVAFAETVIPLEFTYMQEARDRLFPGLTPQERHYMDDHIAHDVEFHMRDILVWLAEMNLTPEQEQRIKDGMYLYYIGRSFMYSDFMDNLESSSKQNSS
jgi:Spy/CpxP family protein refolding chaperone